MAERADPGRVKEQGGTEDSSKFRHFLEYFGHFLGNSGGLGRFWPIWDDFWAVSSRFWADSVPPCR